MAQLSDDCFAFGGRLLTVAEGVALIAERVTAVAEPILVPLADADGTVLAADLIAPIDLPAFDNSAVDGFAVRHADLAPGGDTSLPVRGRIAAGDTSAQTLLLGEAARIFTGARMPAGADTVFMQEDVREQPDGIALLPAGLKRGANRRLAGEDVSAGTLALRSGLRLRPADLALAAALGIARLAVRRPLRVGVLSTGDELAEPGTPLLPGQVYDSNRPLLLAMLRRLGALTTDLGIVRDDPLRLAEILRAATPGHDLVLTSGGVSTGEEDHTRRVIEQAGRLVLWRMAIKPGRPVAMGMLDGTPVIGLPGNPVAVFVTFVHIVRPLLARLRGETWTPPRPIPLPLNFPYRKREGRREYLRVKLIEAPDGSLLLERHGQDGAGVITSLTGTDGLAELVEPLRDLRPGDQAGFLPYTAFV